MGYRLRKHLVEQDSLEVVSVRTSWGVFEKVVPVTRLVSVSTCCLESLWGSAAVQWLYGRKCSHCNKSKEDSCVALFKDRTQ